MAWGYTGSFGGNKGECFNLSMGGAIGVNIHVTDKVSLITQFDYSFILVIGNEPENVNEVSEDWDIDLFDGYSYHGGNIRLGVLYRFNDSY